jgi:hypothetical protein
MADVPFLQVTAAPGGIEAEGAGSYFTGSRAIGAAADGGYFVEWKWDGERVRVRSEPWGFAPVFYHATRDRFIVSTRLGAVLGRLDAAELDLDAVAAFLWLGFFVGDDTPWKAIRAMPRCGSLTWRPGDGVSRDDGWIRPSPIRVDRLDAMSTYAALFRQSVARRSAASGTVVVPLSGGRDSRHILFELVSQGRPPDACVTARHLPERFDDDYRIAKLLCDRLGLRHVVVAQPIRRVRRDEARIDLTNFCSDEHTWGLAVVDALAELRPAQAWDGIAGDVLSAGLFLTEERVTEYREGRLSSVTDALCAKWQAAEPSLLQGLDPDAKNALGKDAARSRIAKELEHHREAANPLSAFYFWNRTRREIAEYSFSMLGTVADPVAPYLDRDLASYLLSLPAALVVDHRFHEDTIRHAYPQWSDVPYETRGAPPLGVRARLYWMTTGADLAGIFGRGEPDGLTDRGAIALRALKFGLALRPWHRQWLSQTAWRLHWLRRVGLATSATARGPNRATGVRSLASFG